MLARIAKQDMDEGLDVVDLEKLSDEPRAAVDGLLEIRPACHHGYRYKHRTLVIICSVCRVEVLHVKVAERPS